MDDRRVVETGPAAQILRAPGEEYTRRLVAAAPTVGARGTTGRAADEVPEPMAPAADVPALEVTDLVRTYRVRGRREPLHAVDGLVHRAPRHHHGAVA
jgi:peptide/nickel transport system ATP-binding protein